MIYLNGNYVALKNASISVMDRGFLFADGVYEVIPIYAGTIFRLDAHLARLNHSLDALDIINPLKKPEWLAIIEKLIQHQNEQDLSIYIQITRGCADTRKHIGQDNLTPTVLIKAKPLTLPTFEQLTKPHYAVSATDIRWSRCDIKSIALLANILLLKQAQQKNAEEVILIRDGMITEGASSNVFIVKNGVVYTRPADEYILGGITRDIVIQSVEALNIPLQQVCFIQKDLLNADEIWISSSTKEIMPISHLNTKPINGGVYGEIWYKVYQQFQVIKQTELSKKCKVFAKV